MRRLLTYMGFAALSFVFAVALPAQTMPASRTNTVETRVAALFSRLTQAEKLLLLGGTGIGTQPIPRLGIPGFAMSDGPSGARNISPSTAYAAGVGLAATFDEALARAVGREIGRDTRARDARFILGPGVNIFRSPLNGRNFEYFGEDPFLASRIAVGYIEGVQSVGVAATVKHFVGNESEFARDTSDSLIDMRTLREIYLPPFEAAVKEAHVGAVMDAYNKLNGDYLTQNGLLNRTILKNEWGFPGIVMSDWFATHDIVSVANGGMDLEMPNARFQNAENLAPLLANGTVSQATIDDKVRRILRLIVRMGWLDKSDKRIEASRYNQEGRAAALRGARESITLLKNAGNLLPLNLNRVKKIAVIGPDAYPAVPTGGGSGRVVAFHSISLLTGLSDAVAGKATVTYARGLPTFAQMARQTRFTTEPGGGEPGLRVQVFADENFTGEPSATRIERNITYGRSFFGSIGEESDSAPTFGGRPAPPAFSRWTGYYDVPTAGKYDLLVQRSEGFRVLIDDKIIVDNWDFVRTTLTQRTVPMSAGAHKIVFEEAKRSPFGGGQGLLAIYKTESLPTPDALALAKDADVVVVAAGFDPLTEIEGTDRAFELPPGQAELIRAVARINKNVVVALTAGGSVETASWRAAAGAILTLHYPGQEGGTAFAEILTGKTNPSGHLPYTWDNRLEDGAAFANYYYTDPKTQAIPYKEGIFVGYRAEGRRPAPLYAFGYGLSYTTFRYSNLTVTARIGKTGWNVAFDVTNTGKRAGDDVPQVYISDTHAPVPRPVRELKGFARVSLAPGVTKRVTVPIDDRSLAYWDVETNQWRADSGVFDVQIGRSARDIVLRRSLILARTSTMKP